MAAKHRTPKAMQRRRQQPRSGTTSLFGLGSASVLCAASLLGLLSVQGDETASEATAPAAVMIDTPWQRPARPISQEGTLIAVSADSMTARSADGYTQTYLVTSDTTVIAGGGNEAATAVAHFRVNDEVAIVGTIHNGTATATAVAHRDLAHGGAPPMDFGF